MARPRSARLQKEIREVLVAEARRRGYNPKVVKALEGPNDGKEAGAVLAFSLASLGETWRRNPQLRPRELLATWQRQGTDPARITRILLLLGEAWRRHPELSLVQLLTQAHAAGTNNDDAGIKYADDRAIERGLAELCEKTTASTDWAPLLEGAVALLQERWTRQKPS